MGLHLSVIILALFPTVLSIYKYIIYPAFLSPLSRIPNAHRTSSISPLWILYKRWKYQDPPAVHAAHLQKGNAISINCVKDGVNIVYAPNFDKSGWYSPLENYGVQSMVSMLAGGPHSIRKRMLSHFYSKSYLLSSPFLSSITSTLVHTRFLHQLTTFASSQSPLDIIPVVLAFTIDMNTSYQFGIAGGTKYMQNEEERNKFVEFYRMRMSCVFWRQELPELTKWMERFGLRVVKRRYDDGHRQLEKIFLRLCDRTAVTYESLTNRKPSSRPVDKLDGGVKEEDYPLVYAQLRSSIETLDSKATGLIPQQTERQRLEIACELFDLLIAGFDTSTITLKWLMYNLCQHPDIQEKLITELRSMDEPLLVSTSSGSTSFPSPKTLDSLPHLEAIILETLRLHPAAPGTLPRLVPQGGATLGGYDNIPTGTRVSAQAYSLHRNADVFLDPEAWKPERWLDAGPEMQMWFWAFGSGGRMCVGKSFAFYRK
ncbi:putative cytochrome P450 monooxygenase [Zopfia rhizophila CBS 207.26]|uniref:Putative cytochrome P450 monooxygenase n=1 Tax=Zopfia rhizophila CBS 207.26 TaxID=1314779 RepID=A0A6A6DHD3_9PEZI|nr:putative cytochrome P450 monooxygenase [Zopfia rhizophila CBS 207.26]